MSGGLSALQIAQLALSGGFVAAGLCFVLVGALGMLRFPDFYTRLHAAGVTDHAGAGLILVGLAIGAWDGATSLRLALFAFFYASLAPVTAQALAGAAHGAGLAPLAGAFRAPRPGTEAP